MAKSTKRKSKRAPKKSGRPKSTGAGTPMVVRMHDPQLKAIDGWIRDTGISRPEAIRQLVDWALENAKKQAEPPPDPPINVVKRARENELRR
jgi:hypothetical protein